MEQLIEILGNADSDKANKTARDKKAVAHVSDNYLLPLANRIVELGGPEHEFIGGLTSKTKPQYVAELRLAVPEIPDLQPRLRIALEKRNKNPELEVYDYFAGVTIVHRWTGPDEEEYSAHIRWGFWATSPKVKDRIVPPYRWLCGTMKWKPEGRLMSRRVVNLKSLWLSLVGGKVDVSEVLDVESLTELQERVAQEMVLLSNAIRR